MSFITHVNSADHDTVNCTFVRLHHLRTQSLDVLPSKDHVRKKCPSRGNKAVTTSHWNSLRHKTFHAQNSFAYYVRENAILHTSTETSQQLAHRPREMIVRSKFLQLSPSSLQRVLPRVGNNVTCLITRESHERCVHLLQHELQIAHSSFHVRRSRQKFEIDEFCRDFQTP